MYDRDDRELSTAIAIVKVLGIIYRLVKLRKLYDADRQGYEISFQPDKDVELLSTLQSMCVS